MPSFSSVQRTGKWQCSTSWMISSFSQAGYLIRRRPIRDHAFFEQAQVQGLLGDDLLQRPGFPAQVLDLAAGRRPRGVARKAPLASLQELLRPGVIQALGDAFTPAQLRDAVLATQTVQHDADLLLGRILLARRPAN